MALSSHKTTVSPKEKNHQERRFTPQMYLLDQHFTEEVTNFLGDFIWGGESVCVSMGRGGADQGKRRENLKQTPCWAECSTQGSIS